MRLPHVLSAIAILAFYGCQDGGSGSSNVAGADDSVGDSGGNGGGESNGGASSGPDDAPLDIPSGTLALFVSLSMDTRNESWPTVGGAVSWEETDTGLLRYLPTLELLDILATTTSFSFSSSHIYPLTVGGRVFVVNTRTRKHIREYDPRTGVLLGTACEVATDDEFSGFAIVGERIFYIDGAGDLAVQDLPCNGTATTLLDANDHAINGRSMYGIDDQFVSVGFRSPDQYEIRRHNDGTGAVDEVLLTIGGAEVFGSSFFAGDGALYWLRFDDRSLELAVVRYTLGGSPQVIITRTFTTALNAGYTIDESRGKVLVVYMDGFPASGGEARFLLYDGIAGAVEELAIDTSFYSQRIFGTQFLVLE